MLSKKIFDQNMAILSVYFNSFEFPIFPNKDNYLEQLKYDIWYNAFSEIDDNTFQLLIKAYCSNNVYAPQSPSSILQTYKEVKQSNIMSSEQAWEIVDKNLWRGIRGYQTLSNGRQVYHNDFYESIKEHTQIVEVCKEIESSLADITSDSKSYVRREFMDVYKRHSEQAVSIGYDERLKIT